LLDKVNIQSFVEDGGIIATFKLELEDVRNTSEIQAIMKNVTGGCRFLGDLTISSVTIIGRNKDHVR